MEKMFTKKLLASAAALFIIFYLTNNNENSIMKTTTISVKAGESGKDFLKRNQLSERNNTDKQPMGVTFYDIQWDASQTGTVMVENGQQSFATPFALGVTGAENVRREEGIEQFTINSLMTNDNSIAHDQARQLFYAYLQKLLKLGWKPFIPHNTPRLTGQQAYRYAAQENLYMAMPSDYEPTLDEWMQIEHAAWYLHSNGVFLEIGFQRSRHLMDPKNPGAYLLNVALTSKIFEAKSHFSGEERNQWETLWVDRIKSLKRERYQKEAELIKRGFTIYTDYQEPKIHPLDPIEP